jgi:AraC-like DNA-binding protein
MDARLTWKNSFKTDRKENFGLTVRNSGSQRCQPGHTWGFAMRGHYLIHLVTAGKGTYKTGDLSFSLGVGDVFLIHPGTLAYYQADDNEPWEYYWVGFWGSDAQNLLNLCGFKNTLVINLLPHAHRLRAEISSIHSLRGRDIASEVRMTGALYLFLSSLITLNMDAHPKRIYTTPLEQAVQYINGNFCEQINVQDIARHAGVSRSQLYRLFMQGPGISPIEYLLKKRIAEACRLFSAHNLSVSEAALSVGFSDPLYFSRVFKKLNGVNPSTFRQNNSI